MSEIADFLRARYQDVREGQQRIFRNTWEVGAPCPACGRPTSGMRTYEGIPGPIASFEPCRHEIHDPALLRQFEEPAPDRDVLADLDAKLRILNEVVPEIDAMEDRIDGEWGAGDPAERESTTLLRILAQPFAEHPDHRGEEWTL